MSRQRWTWGVFAVCVGCGAGLLAWLTATMLRLERAEVEARAHAQHEIAIGAALWQMDGWLLPLLATEARRPVTDYQSFNPIAVAYTNLFSKLTPGEVVAPSPLLELRSPYFLLHFQIDGGGKLTSPQVPEGNALDVTQSQAGAPQFEAQRTLLESLRRVLTPVKLDACCSVGTAALPEVQIAQQNADNPGSESAWTSNFQQRAQFASQARGQIEAPTTGSASPLAPTLAASEPGQLVPMWIDDPRGGERLAFVRRVTMGDDRLFQGVIADWDALRRAMIAQISDPAIAASARLHRVDRPNAVNQPHLLTVLPALLEVAPPTIDMPGWSPARSLLAGTWLALLATALVVAFTLRAALNFGDRRARFASAVTHELRTPLTTFKMYSEMLATGMVSDPARRQQYLLTLHAESDRLARLVENVLGYARIEDGRFTARIETITLGDLVARLRPILARRTSDVGTEPVVTVHDEGSRLDVDADAVGQILFNLVDNACKYGKPPIRLDGRVDEGLVRLTVHDHGPGVPAGYRARIFAAFDRGVREPGDNETPGIGLGLALARGLARDLGGDLQLRDVETGACFELSLPSRASAR